MIQTKKDLKDYLIEDSKNYVSQTKSYINKLKSNFNSSPISDQSKIWMYIRTMRYLEFHNTKKGLLHKFLSWFYSSRLKKLAYYTGFQIPPNTCGKGLTIWHWGPIIVNPRAKIGNFCTLYPGVLIGHKEEGCPAPIIGNNVFIGSGTKIIGDIKIEDNVTIGPNSIIVKNVPRNTTIVGNPARIIKIDSKDVDIKL